MKKNKYIYYHCTGNKGKCPEKWVREELIAEQFGQIIGNLRTDSEVLAWVVAALKESHQDEKKYHEDIILGLQNKYHQLQMRIDAMYDDKLDGRIDQDFYDRKSSEWKIEQDVILKKIERHQGANRAYFDDGVQLLELAQRAVVLYEKQDMQEKRRIINFVCSNSLWKDGRIIPNYRQPFDMIAEINTKGAEEKTENLTESGLRSRWLGDRDSNPDKRSQSPPSCH